MKRVITRADVEELELDQTAIVTPEEKAEQLIEWAEGLDVDLGADVSPRSLYVSAAGLYGFAGDAQRQWGLLDRAERAEGRSAVDVRAYRAEVLLGRDDRAAANDLADQIRTDRSANPYTCHFLGEAFERHDDDAAAERWFNIGLRVLEELDPDMIESTSWDLLLVGRHRLRQRLGRPMDHYDDEADAVSRIHREGI